MTATFRGGPLKCSYGVWGAL